MANKALLEEIQKKLGQPAVPALPVRRRKKNNYSMVILFIVVLAISSLVVYNFKSDGMLLKWVAAKLKKEEVVPPDVNDDLRSEFNQFKADFEKLSKNVKWNNDRIALLGLVSNENGLIVRGNGDKSKMVFFNRDWTIDKMPVNLELSEADKEYLSKYVKSR